MQIPQFLQTFLNYIFGIIQKVVIVAEEKIIKKSKLSDNEKNNLRVMFEQGKIDDIRKEAIDFKREKQSLIELKDKFLWWFIASAILFSVFIILSNIFPIVQFLTISLLPFLFFGFHAYLLNFYGKITKSFIIKVVVIWFVIWVSSFILMFEFILDSNILAQDYIAFIYLVSTTMGVVVGYTLSDSTNAYLPRDDEGHYKHSYFKAKYPINEIESLILQTLKLSLRINTILIENEFEDNGVNGEVYDLKNFYKLFLLRKEKKLFYFVFRKNGRIFFQDDKAKKLQTNIDVIFENILKFSSIKSPRIIQNLEEKHSLMWDDYKSPSFNLEKYWEGSKGILSSNVIKSAISAAIGGIEGSEEPFDFTVLPR
jgi:hypothetical protein